MKRVFLVFVLTILLTFGLIALAITGEAVKDPVCGMELNPAEAAVQIAGSHGTLYFCSETCKQKFCANPTAFVTPEQLQKLGIESANTGKGACCTRADKQSATEADPHSMSSPEGCGGQCGHTKVPAINEFHSAMMPLKMAVQRGDLQTVKAGYTELIAKKEAVVNAPCPEGLCAYGFKSLQADFGIKVDAFASACQAGDEAAIKQTFAEMHEAYEALDQMAR